MVLVVCCVFSSGVGNGECGVGMRVNGVGCGECECRVRNRIPSREVSNRNLLRESLKKSPMDGRFYEKGVYV